MSEEQELLYYPMTEISWCAADIKQIYPDWSDEYCIEVMQQIASRLEERCIELGWEVLEFIVSEYEEEEDEIN